MARKAPSPTSWIAEAKKKDGFDPTGFLKIIDDLPIKRKDGGIGALGKLANPVQRARWEWIVEQRRQRKPIRRIEIKIRQLASMSTAVGAAIWGDVVTNGEGFDCLVTAHRPDSLMTLSRMYRRFAGGEKKEGGAKRLADDLIQGPHGGYVVLQSANRELGRSESITHAHVSEADYIEDFNAAMDSFMPAMSPAWWSMVFLETTMRQGINTEFKDFVEAAARGEAQPWSVDFTAWWMLPQCIVQMDRSEKARMSENLTDYEIMLHNKLRLSLEQIAWYRKTLGEHGRGRLDAMQEMYPSTIDEALRIGGGAEFFHDSAMAWYKERCKPPALRYLLRYEGVREVTDPRDYAGEPHLAVWNVPRVGSRYVIGADPADNENRDDPNAGSECYAVVVDIHTGEVCAEYHGHTNDQDFAVALWRAAQYYNHALVIPESNAGAGVIDHLMNVLQYTNVYERETFGSTVYRNAGVYGFRTNTTSRPILIGRLQDCINKRLIALPSENLHRQLTALGKRRGRPQKRQSRGGVPDDGCIALALCMFGHTHAIDGIWQSKDVTTLPEPDAIDYANPDANERRSMYQILGVERDFYKRKRKAAGAFMDRS